MSNALKILVLAAAPALCHGGMSVAGQQETVAAS
jgi:hypothetical protein